MKTSIRELNRQHAETKKGNPFSGSALAGIKSYALGVASVGTAIAVVKSAFEAYQAEVEKGKDETIRQRDSRRNLLQVSDETNFKARLKRVDAAAVEFGVTREAAAATLFDAISNDAEADFETILQADRVIPAKTGAKFAGEFRQLFPEEKLTASQALNLGLSAASQSAFNAQELQPQIAKAAQGSKLLPGVESSDVAAVVSVLAAQLKEQTGTTIKTLQANAGAELIKQKGKLDTETDAGARKKIQRDIDTLSGSLPNVIAGISKNKELRESIVGGNIELLTAVTVAGKSIDKINAVDKRVERDVSQAGTGKSLIRRRLGAFFSDPEAGS